MHQSASFVSVVILPDGGSARLLADVLADHDIPVELCRVPPGSFLGALSLVTIDRYDVRVPPEQLAEARRLHQELEAAEPVPGTDGDAPELDPELQARQARLAPQAGAALILAALVPAPVSCLYVRAVRLGGLLMAVYVWALLLLLHDPLQRSALGLMLFCKLLDAAAALWWLRRDRAPAA